MAERLRNALVIWMALAFSGCAILDKSDSFGAEGHLRISGGLLAEILPTIDIGGKIGFFKQYPKGLEGLDKLCKECRLKILEGYYADQQADDGALTPLEHFL